MKSKIVNPLLVLLFHARMNDCFVGGDDNYARGKKLLAQLSHRRKTAMWATGIGGLTAVAAVTLCVWRYAAPIIGDQYVPRLAMLAATVAGFVAAAVLMSVAATFRERLEELAAPPPASRTWPYEPKWEEAPVAAALASDMVIANLERILELGEKLGLGFPRDEVTSLVGLGKLLESLARPAHARVEELQKGKVQSPELSDLKELLRLAAPVGHKILTLVWDDQKEAHEKKPFTGSKKPTLVQLAPFSWPGL